MRFPAGAIYLIEKRTSHPMNTEAVSTTGKTLLGRGRSPAFSAVGSVLAALTCCLPVLRLCSLLVGLKKQR